MFGFSGGADEEKIKRAQTWSLISGILFGIAWWLYIDGAAFGSKLESGDVVSKANGYSWIPGVVLTIVFFMINAMPWHELNNQDDPGAQGRARGFLVLAMVLGLASLVIAIWLMSDKFLKPHADGATQYAGISLFVSNLLIFLSTFVMRFSTLPDTEDAGPMF